MKKMLIIITIVSLGFLMNVNDAKAVAEVSAKFTVVLQFKGIFTWPTCDKPKDNCTVEISGKVGKLTLDPSNGNGYFNIFYSSGDYDTNNDGTVEVTHNFPNIGPTITLGDFILKAEFTQGEGDVLVRVVDQPIDPATGAFRAYKVVL